MEKNNKERFIVIDGSSVMYRAFHAVPPTFTNSRGLPTNAVYGFTQTLRKILKEFQPDFAAVAFDVKGPTFRHGLFDGYKAERPPMPDALSAQVPYVKDVAAAFGVPVVEMEGFEADDVIATLVKRGEGAGLKVALVTGDKDLYQLVGGDTVILDYNTGKEYGPVEVEDKFGVPPVLIRDLIALAGDASDSIPGVPKVGLKTAAKLLKQFGSFEAIYEGLEEVSGEKLKENLKNFKDQALLSRELATLHLDVPVTFEQEAFRFKGPDFSLLEPLLTELDFKRILKEMLPAAPAPAEGPGGGEKAASAEDLGRFLSGFKSLSITALFKGEGFGSPLSAIAFAREGGIISAECGEAPGSITEQGLLNAIAPFIEDGTVRKDTPDSKGLYLYFSRMGLRLSGVGIDTSIASYVLNPSRAGHDMETLAYEFLDARPPEGGEGPAARAERYAGHLSRIAPILEGELKREGLEPLYREMELALSEVLSDMESAGIKADPEQLRALSREMEVQLGGLERSIYVSAGTEFNINSPKQLSEVLFERLGLRPLKKTKTGFSTDEEVLSQLALLHEVPRQILNFRQLSKLKSTYVDAILGLINPATGRVHTSFNQTVTATGRLSSSRPNLQNIPVRGEAASRIREAFVAGKGFRFLSADYSQIELRIVAHLSGDEILSDAFTKGEDVHTRTASEVFGVMPGLVTREMRRRAKAINFGIIYGMGPFGLSAELGISMKEATEYINRYFERYRGVKGFIDRTVREAKERGYTVTLFGRRRFIPELNSGIESVSRLGQRLAINTPIQGTAADMIKAAMIRIHRVLKGSGSASRLILQIHDELVVEAAEGEAAKVSSLMRDEMESVLRLTVPVVVNLKSGDNWNMVEGD